jgi:hypothetical protein
MRNQIIGKTMFHGYAGSFSRQPDTIIDTHPACGAIAFGGAVVYSNGAVTAPGASATAADFVGVAVRETKSATNYLDQNEGSYVQYDAVPVLKRGCVNVICQNGTPALDGTVYVRVAENASYPDCVISGFEASSDSTNTIQVSNIEWTTGVIDSNLITEVTVKTRAKG